MANTITKAERERIQTWADAQVKLDPETGELLEAHRLITALRQEFDISEERARTHAYKAARRARHPDRWPGAARQREADRVPGKRFVGVYVAADVLTEAKVRAVREDTSLSAVVERLLAGWVGVA